MDSLSTNFRGQFHACISVVIACIYLPPNLLYMIISPSGAHFSYIPDLIRSSFSIVSGNESVIFVLATPGSKLQKEYQREIRESGLRVKVVESQERDDNKEYGAEIE